MNESDDKKKREKKLRATAESTIPFAPAPTALPVEDLLHELRVHQIELEMQNEALRLAQTELEASRDRYVDLYDFAPVGYLTLDANGMLEELNLTAATLLGTVRKDLLHRNFLARVKAEDHPRWVALFARIKAGDARGSVELTLKRGDGTVFQAQLDVVKQEVGAGDTALRIALTDISRRKATEAAQAQLINELERFNRVAVDREIVMIGLKRRVNALSHELERTPPFALDFADVPGEGKPQ